MTYILAGSAGLYVFLFMLWILSTLTRDRRIVEHRLRDLIKQDIELDRPIKIQRVRHRRMPVSQNLANDLISAGVRMRPEEYVVVWGLSTLAPATLFAFLQANPITVFTIAIIGLAIPPYLVSRNKAKRLVRFESQLSEALVMAANGLRAGLTFQQAMNNIASEMPDPIGREFSRAVREINLGSSVENALGHMAERIDSLDLSLAVSAIQIQRQVGGNLLELLENISETIQDRIKVKNDIKVLTASGRSSGFIIGMLPIAMIGLLSLINPGYMESFFETQMGVTMLIVGGIMEAIGFLAIRKIVTIKY